jgi:hypothetical protein
VVATTTTVVNLVRMLKERIGRFGRAQWWQISRRLPQGCSLSHEVRNSLNRVSIWLPKG